jgi:5-methylthioadenosine/S-adenosylhomocysteine deaminase
MTDRTAIRNGKVVAWVDGAQRVLQRATVIVEGDRIVSVGDDAPATRELDAAGMLVLPGFVNMHSHVTDTAFTRDYLEESAGPKDYANLYRVLPAVRNAIDARDACIGAKALLLEALLAGTTTIVEMGYDVEVAGSADLDNAHEVAELAVAAGLRCYSAPRYRRGYWRGDATGKIGYYDYPDGGRTRMEACVAFCRDQNGRHADMLRTMLAPGQVDTCDPDMLRETRRVADATGLLIQLHAGQSLAEFRRIRETHGQSTIRYLEGVGLLGGDFIIGHGMFLAETNDVGAIPAEEMALLADTGTNVVHLPWPKMRQGTIMNSYAKFIRAGVNVALGTDTHPMDMIHEMRVAVIGCKLAEQSQQATTAMEAFNMATVHGARALGRDDLGRLAPNCKADIVLVDLSKPRAAGYDDPLKYLVYNGDGCDVDTVMVNGEVVVRGGVPLRADLAEAMTKMIEAKARVRAKVFI